MGAIVKIGDIEMAPARITSDLVFAWITGRFGDPLEHVELIDGVLIDKSEMPVDEDAKIVMDGIEIRPGRIDNALLRAMWNTEFAADLERVELIDGILVEMTPAKRRHGHAQTRISAAILAQLPSGLDVLSDSMIFLGKNTMFAPDIAVLPLGREVEDAAPEEFRLAIEISETTLRNDLRSKARRYGVHGVPEYWVLDIDHRKLHVHREPGPEGYGSVVAQEWSEKITPLFAPELVLDLSAILKDIG